MFGKLFNRFKTRPVVPPPAAASKTPAPAPVPVPVPSAAAVEAPASPDQGFANHTRIYKTAPVHVPVAANPESLFSSAPPAPPTPEELCGITPDMGPDKIREALAHLYRRHNRLTSSLNPELRAEAEMMLDAIVDVRHKHFGEDIL